MNEQFKSATLRNALEYDGKAKLEAVISKTMASQPDLRSNIKSIIPEVKRLLNQINSLAISEQRALLQEMSPTADAKKHAEKISGLPPSADGAEIGNVVQNFLPSQTVIHISDTQKQLLSIMNTPGCTMVN